MQRLWFPLNHYHTFPKIKEYLNLISIPTLTLAASDSPFELSDRSVSQEQPSKKVDSTNTTFDTGRRYPHRQPHVEWERKNWIVSEHESRWFNLLIESWFLHSSHPPVYLCIFCCCTWKIHIYFFSIFSFLFFYIFFGAFTLSSDARIWLNTWWITQIHSKQLCWIEMKLFIRLENGWRK